MNNKPGVMSLFDEIIVDNFAGGGGASTGMELATGRPVAIAINHDPAAILMHQTNHPYTKHFTESIWNVDPVEICEGHPVGLAWFSPDCKHFSKAKGSALIDRNIRGLAWIVLRWAGAVRPRVIMLENVEEFQTWGPVRKGKAIKSKSGQTFKKWLSQLEELGYTVDHRELVAADYGTPTTRKRFFLIARCDGLAIVWPEKTHAPIDSAEAKNGTLKPWVSAAKIIDWTLPVPSIFSSSAEIKAEYGLRAVRPLADNTLKRIARGTDKFFIKSAKPFFVTVNHSGNDYRGQSIDKPLSTVTSKNGSGIASPLLTKFQQNSIGQSLNSPLDTVMPGATRFGLTAPIMTAIGQTGFSDDRSYSVETPVKTVVSKAEQCVIAPTLIQYHSEQSDYTRGQALEAPLMTADGSNRYGLTAAHLTEWYGNAQDGLDLANPMHTQTAKDREALTAVHVAEFKGQDKGQSIHNPLRTITASIGEFGQVCSYLKKYKPGTELKYWPQIREMLNTYCGYTIADDEVLIFNINGIEYFISDIGLRMLSPKELYKAQGFPDDYIIDVDYLGNTYKKSAQVARCGNAVCPPMAEALVRANIPEWCETKISNMAELLDRIAI